MASMRCQVLRVACIAGKAGSYGMQVDIQIKMFMLQEAFSQCDTVSLRAKAR